MFEKAGDLMYEVDNLEDTIAYCSAHNPIVLSYPPAARREAFLERVLRKVGGLACSDLAAAAGRMERVFNAFYVIDPFDPFAQTVPMASGLVPGTHVVNFFVRPGRKVLDPSAQPD